jgi:hypothetical protein
MPSSNPAESSLRLFKTSLRWFSVRQALRKLDNWNLLLALAARRNAKYSLKSCMGRSFTAAFCENRPRMVDLLSAKGARFELI